ncbi:hypothetical protein SALBM311S_02420 [Streptomyces alboniger]
MDPGLSPQSIADAHHVSVRYVHKLFESEDTTLAKWIQTRRLAMCRRDLARHSSRGLGVASVARRWGFVSPAHFSRAFRPRTACRPATGRRRRARASTRGLRRTGRVRHTRTLTRDERS